MISHNHILTPTASFVAEDLFINDTTDKYDTPRILHIVNHYTQDIAIKILSKDEDGSSYSGIVLAPEDIIDIETMTAYVAEVKYISSGSGTVIISGYNYYPTTK